MTNDAVGKGMKLGLEPCRVGRRRGQGWEEREAGVTDLTDGVSGLGTEFREKG